MCAVAEWLSNSRRLPHVQNEEAIQMYASQNPRQDSHVERGCAIYHWILIIAFDQKTHRHRKEFIWQHLHRQVGQEQEQTGTIHTDITQLNKINKQNKTDVKTAAHTHTHTLRNTTQQQEKETDGQTHKSKTNKWQKPERKAKQNKKTWVGWRPNEPPQQPQNRQTRRDQ